MRRLITIAMALLVACGGLATATRTPAGALDNGLAPTPPMGWNGYNHFSRDVTASIVEAQARALVASGMKSAGYEYVNLDGGWDLLERDAAGNLQPDPAKFPDGIAPVAAYVHSLGLKFGIYTSAGTANCANTSAGSYGHYDQDARTFADWGVDYVKLDRCNVPYDDFPTLTQPEVTQLLATRMHDAILAAGRPMVFDVNDARQSEHDWTWAPAIANVWRIVGDIADRYSSMVNHLVADVTHASEVAPGGGWSDPDMLEVGNGGMTDTEYRSEFSLWAELAAPLIAGNDLTAMSATTRDILTNRGVIAVDQDPLGQQGYPVSNADGHWVLTRPLADGDRAVVLFNQTDVTATITTSATEVGLPSTPVYLLRDLWRPGTAVTNGPISADVPPHAVVMYRVSPRPPMTPPGSDQASA
ncbi:MAG TPA: glycoside hydrolase family 27 protein [Jatrophihabitantaceae bacterium]|jgi:alpha-galactosidase